MKNIQKKFVDQGIILFDDAHNKELAIKRCKELIDLINSIINVLQDQETLELEQKIEVMKMSEDRIQFIMALYPTDFFGFINVYLRSLIDEAKRLKEKELEEENKPQQMKLKKMRKRKQSDAEERQLSKKIVIMKNPRKFIYNIANAINTGAKSDPELAFIGDNNTIADMIQRSVVDKDGKSFEHSTICQYESTPKID
jgi:hypothetical protein